MIQRTLTILALVLLVGVGILAATGEGTVTAQEPVVDTHGPAPAVRATRSGDLPILHNYTMAVPWDVDDFDDANMHSTAPAGPPFHYGVYAQVDGAYIATAHINWSGNSTGRREVALRLDDAETGALRTVAITEGPPTGGGAATQQSVSGIVRMTEGDFIYARVIQTSGTTLTIDKASHLALARVGS